MSTRPVRLIRVQPNPVFQEPKHLPTKPLTHAPIDIELPPDPSTSCIHRASFKDIHTDLLKEYAKHYDIKIDHEKVLRAEIMAVLCMKNEWIPKLPKRNITHVEDAHLPPSETTSQAIPEDGGDAPVVGPDAEVESYIPDRFGTPEDSYDNDTGSSTEAADPNSKDPEGDASGDLDFDIPMSTVSLGDLTKLTSRLQARHTQVQCALRDATSATREAAANVLGMIARVENEKARMEKIMRTVSEIVGEYDVEIEGSDGEVEEVESVMVSAKRKGKGRATDPIRSSAHSSFRRGHNSGGLRPSPLCPNCRVARDLTVSQRHSIYLCAEHMPNPYQANGTPNQGSTASTSAAGSSSSARNDKRANGRFLNSSSSLDSTIIFGLTTKSVPTPNSKGKKRSLEESEAEQASHSSSTSRNQSPKRARVERNNTNSQQRPSSSPTLAPRKTAPLTRTISISDINALDAVRDEMASHLRRTISNNVIDPKEIPEWEEASAPTRGDPLRRTFTINDFNDPEEVANVERMESSCSRRRVVPSTTRRISPEEAVVDAERNAALRSNAPSRTLSINGVNDPEDVANAVGTERQKPMMPGVNNPDPVAIFDQQRPGRNAPLRRTISIHDLDDPEEIANAERVENFPPLRGGNTTPGLTISTDGEVRRTNNEPLQRTFTISNINDPGEVARVEMLTTGRVKLPKAQSPRVDVLLPRRIRERLRETPTTRTATGPVVADAHEASAFGSEMAGSTSSDTMPGKRLRDSDDEEDGQGKLQKKARITENSNDL